MTPPESVLVVVGGGPVRVPAAMRADLVVAADSGLDAARAAGLRPDVLVGDLDSISAAGLAWARAEGVLIETHPADKDHTDTDLALHRAVGLGGRHLILLASDGAGSTGHRLDHLLGTIAALGAPALAVCESVTAFVGGTALHVVHPGHSVALRLDPGAVFSLVAAHGPCEGVTLSGARWPLDHASLPASSTRGISNEAVDSTVDVTVVAVTVVDGIVTVVVPEVVS
ncbi:MAG: thiamine diphosphokinase [Actinomycetota bacterium]